MIPYLLHQFADPSDALPPHDAPASWQAALVAVLLLRAVLWIVLVTPPFWVAAFGWVRA